jgi:hypothetical protein
MRALGCRSTGAVALAAARGRAGRVAAVATVAPLRPIYSGVGTRVIDPARLAASNQGSLSPALRSQDARLNARSELE